MEKKSLCFAKLNLITIASRQVGLRLVSLTFAIDSGKCA